MTNLIEVNAILFRAAAECQSTEETRYYLNGVYITPHPVKGIVLTATDGHRLISIHDEQGKCSTPKIVYIDPKAIDGKAMAAMRRAMMADTPAVEPVLQICINEAGIATVGTYRSLKSCFIDGTFPDWHRIAAPLVVRAKEGKYCPGSYNQKYVAAFGKIAVMLSPGNDQSASIRIVSVTEEDPSRVRIGNLDHAFGILMPMRASSSNHIPAWMQPILEPAPAAVAPVAKKTAAKTSPVRRAAAARKPARAVKKPAKRKAA